MSFLYRLLEPGASLHPFEVLIMFSLPVAFFAVQDTWGDDIFSLFQWNALCQIVIFAVMVNIPTYVTGRMSYVDMGWPTGLFVMGLNAVVFGTAPLTRRLLVGIPMLLHGGRMAVGAVWGMYISKKVSYYKAFEREDLSRYQYAKVRWCEHVGKEQGESTWWMKMQSDTIAQACANSVVLAAPLFLGTVCVCIVCV